MPASSRVLGGTFHSVAHRLVRRHAAALGLPGGFGVLDAGDAADVLDLLREEHGHAQARTRFPRKGTLLDIYSRTVNAQEPLSGVIAEHFPWCEDHREAISALFKAYTARKRALGVIDLDDLLLFWRALARDEVIGPRLAASFDHVLVDEYQDVNGLQVDLVARARRARAGRHRGGRRLPGDLRLPLGLRGAHPRLPGALRGHARGDAGAQLPLDPAGARRGERGRGAGDARVPEAPAAPTARAACARA